MVLFYLTIFPIWVHQNHNSNHNRFLVQGIFISHMISRLRWSLSCLFHHLSLLLLLLRLPRYRQTRTWLHSRFWGLLRFFDVFLLISQRVPSTYRLKLCKVIKRYPCHTWGRCIWLYLCRGRLRFVRNMFRNIWRKWRFRWRQFQGFRLNWLLLWFL